MLNITRKKLNGGESPVPVLVSNKTDRQMATNVIDRFELGCPYDADLKLAIAHLKAFLGKFNDDNIIRCKHEHEVATGYVLTVHHFDGNKSNCDWWNLLALCQRCHLSFQSRVNPSVPYFFEHSDWLKPYVAGYYAQKYLLEDLSREDVESRIDELLGLELIA
jgi:5-methylcytosine-specific restriction endonuclease McrA